MVRKDSTINDGEESILVEKQNIVDMVYSLGRKCISLRKGTLAKIKFLKDTSYRPLQQSGKLHEAELNETNSMRKMKDKVHNRTWQNGASETSTIGMSLASRVVNPSKTTIMETGEVIFRMSFRTKNGKLVVSKNGRPFPIRISSKRK